MCTVGVHGCNDRKSFISMFCENTVLFYFIWFVTLYWQILSCKLFCKKEQLSQLSLCYCTEWALKNYSIRVQKKKKRITAIALIVMEIFWLLFFLLFAVSWIMMCKTKTKQNKTTFFSLKRVLYLEFLFLSVLHAGKRVAFLDKIQFERASSFNISGDFPIRLISDHGLCQNYWPFCFFGIGGLHFRRLSET